MASYHPTVDYFPVAAGLIVFYSLFIRLDYKMLTKQS